MSEEQKPIDNQSVEGRDLAFETEVMHRMYGAYVKKYIDRMQQMDRAAGFVRDDTFHNVHSSSHIMYKLKVGPDGATRLLSGDGHRAYEFLVEFDKDDPEYGIYYGCRGLILDGSQQAEIDAFLAEWEHVKPEVCAVLNNTFVHLDFTGRFQMTNNASNRTFWPFWIALGEEEDVVQVAALATRLIANVYKRFLAGKTLYSNAPEKKHATVQTRYTDVAYRNVLKQIEKKHGAQAMEQYRAFIHAAEKKGIIRRDDRYEICWKFVDVKNVVVAHLINLLCDEIHLKTPTASSTGKTPVPWEYFTPMFLSRLDEPFESIKNSFSQSKNDPCGRPEDYVNEARKILNKLKIIR